MLLEDPLICRWVPQLNRSSWRRIYTALAAVFLLLGRFSIAYGSEVPVERVAVPRNEEGFFTKPLLLTTNVTPEPEPVPPKRVYPAKTYTNASMLGGNGYARGYCTWYVAGIRTDLPTDLGNARTWLARASAQGLRTGDEPAVGAVVATAESRYGHVALVTGITEGAIIVTEMNVVGWNKVSTRSIPLDSATIQGYIY